jgi:hypothetical protein
VLRTTGRLKALATRLGADFSRRRKVDGFHEVGLGVAIWIGRESVLFGGLMATRSTARSANDSPFCDAWVAMEKIIERLLAMASEGASVDQVTRLLATDKAAMLRDPLPIRIRRASWSPV